MYKAYGPGGISRMVPGYDWNKSLEIWNGVAQRGRKRF